MEGVEMEGVEMEGQVVEGGEDGGRWKVCLATIRIRIWIR